MTTDATIIVVGVGRSGTSLLQSMLASHPDVVFPPETSFLRRLVASGVLARALNRGGASEYVRVLEADENLRRMGIRAQDLVDRTMGADCSPRTLYRSLLESYAERQSKPRYGDKDPRLVEYLPLVWEVFPDAQIIHVIRDPRDVLASKKKAAWSSGRGVLRHVFANRVQFKMGQWNDGNRYGNQYHELVYEELLDNPEFELKKLCDAIKLRFEPAMLSFGDTAKGLVSKEELSWKRETLGPLLRDNRNKWKTELSDWEVALTELVCSAHFEGGRYPRSGKIRGLTAFGRLSVYMTWLGLAILDPIYRCYRVHTVRRARKYL